MERTVLSRLCFGSVVVLLAMSGSRLNAGGPRSLTITYHSDPEGAMLYANAANTLFGYTPMTLKYKPSDAFKKGKECFRVQQSMVRWASGAEAKIDNLDACPQNGATQQFVFVRPEGVPGREIDAQVGAQWQLLLQQQAMQQELETQAYLQRLSNIWNSYSQAIQANRQRLGQVNCTSHAIGSYVYTNCSG